MKYYVMAFCLALLASVAPMVPAAAASPPHVTITAKDFQFSPAVVTLKKNQTTQISIVASEGVHGLSVPEIGLQPVVITSKPTIVSVTPKTAGTFVSHCTTYCGIGHAKMQITFKVVP